MGQKEGRSSNAWHGHFEPKRVPEKVWIGCEGCQATLFRKQVEQNLLVCPECNHHFTVSAAERIAQLLDADTFEEWFADLQPTDPLQFNDRRPYPDRVKSEQALTGLKEAAVVGQGFIRGIRIVFGITDSKFIMGSMGSVVGEKLTRAVEEATRQRLPLVIVSGSGGGARMHEGIFSLMQMAKVSTALGRYHAAGGLYLSVLTHPTMGGVAASFASLGRFHPRRAQGTDRLRRPARHRADRTGPAPRGFSDQRIPPRAWIHRQDRPPEGPPEHDRPAHYLRHALITAASRRGTVDRSRKVIGRQGIAYPMDPSINGARWGHPRRHYGLREVGVPYRCCWPTLRQPPRELIGRRELPGRDLSGAYRLADPLGELALT